MTLEEKILFCEGKNFWETKACPQLNLPSMFMSDGPHGLRKQLVGADHLGIKASVPATCFPTAVTTACSWDVDLLSEIGAAIGREAAHHGVGVVLGPGANLKRNPLCGRNFEYFSEDPVLSGKLAAAFIRGLQEKGISACLKHFACNNQETLRFLSDSVIDERTLRELYLTAFEIAVKEGKPGAVMCAYNKINGVYASDNAYLLTRILREEWGFEGLVMTDWAAMNHRVEAFRAGCDLNMPGGSDYMLAETVTAVQTGRLAEDLVDASVARVQRLVTRGVQAVKEPPALDVDTHHALALKAAQEGAVLLKNQGGILPFAPGIKLAVLGNMVADMRYQGAGSSYVNPTRFSQPAEWFNDAVPLENAQAVLILTGLPAKEESEGFDRAHLRLPDSEVQLIEETCKRHPKVVVALFCGAPVEAPWAEHCQGILYLGLPGQAGAEALHSLVYGLANPSGKLAETWPVRYEDCPSSATYGSRDAVYAEGIFVGYRHVDIAGLTPLWPFGHGLSYTRFTVTQARVAGMRVSAQVTNRGDRAGAAIIQVYVAPPQGSQNRPVKELKRFTKVFLKPGESRELAFTLDERCFAIWQEGWKTPPGTYTILVGEDATALLNAGSVVLEGEALVPDAPWESLKPAPQNPSRKGAYTMNDTVRDMRATSLAMKLLSFGIAKTLQKGASPGSPEYRMMEEASIGSPLRSVAIASGQPYSLFEGLLDLANGKPLAGFRKILSGRRK